jgi:ABC-type Fe3+/spermidine/putrescine transport system ATPase subunit
VLVSVRPENLHVSEQPSDGGIKGRVAEVVYVGAYTRLLLDVGQTRLLAANVPAGSSFVGGADVVATFSASNAVAFRDQEAVDTM